MMIVCNQVFLISVPMQRGSWLCLTANASQFNFIRFIMRSKSNRLVVEFLRVADMSILFSLLNLPEENYTLVIGSCCIEIIWQIKQWRTNRTWCEFKVSRVIKKLAIINKKPSHVTVFSNLFQFYDLVHFLWRY